MPTGRPYRIARHIVLAVAAAIVLVLVFGWVVMVAWNTVVPPVFGMAALAYWQAVALLVLARILAGRFTGGHHGRFHRHGRGPCRGGALYSVWWDAEGEAAFRRYAERQAGEGNGATP